MPYLLHWPSWKPPARAWAFALIGIHEYLARFAGERRAEQVQEELAMLLCGQSMQNPTMTEAGLESLKWLADLQHTDPQGRDFVPIGSICRDLIGFDWDKDSVHPVR